MYNMYLNYIKKSMFMKIYIIPSILISPIFALSCNSWFSIWLIMEFNLMTFLPFIIMFNKYNKEISIKYFIIQTFSSSFLLMFTNMMYFNLNFSNNLNLLSIMINLTIFMKIGTAPFHSWFINMMNSMNWINCFMLSTWQKIIPIMSLMYFFNKSLIYFIIFLSSIIGCFYGLNHQSLRMIISYSSINHISWILITLLFSEWMCMIYFITYMISNMSVMMILNYYNIYYMNQLFYLNLSYNNKMILFFNLTSISGLPPTIGFLIKWLTINYSSLNKFSLMMLFLMLISIISFFFYFRLTIMIMMNLNLNNKLNFLLFKFKIKNNKFMLNNLLIIIMFCNIWLMSMWLF